MIELNQVCKNYKMGGEVIKALDNVNLQIKDGEFVAIMGPSGSGKSTLMHIIGGLDTPDSGKVIINNQNITHLNDKKLSRYRNKEVGFVFQTFNLQPTYTALENTALPLYFAKIPGKQKIEKAKGSLELVGLEDRIKHKPNQLSGGQRQRVSIARALVCDPKIVLADEPTGNLDSKTGTNIINLLKKFNRQKKITIIMVTHDSQMASFADRVIDIHDGKIES